MKHHAFHERSQAAWEAQRARLAEAVVLHGAAGIGRRTEGRCGRSSAAG